MKQTSLIRTLQTLALAWLLLLTGGSHSPVLEGASKDFFCRYPHFQADNDTIITELSLYTEQIDVCNYDPLEVKGEFLLRIHFNKSILKTDSLFVIELAIAYRNDLVMINGAWPSGYLSGNVKYPVAVSTEPVQGTNYSLYKIQCGHDAPLYGSAGIILLSGQLLSDTIACADFLLYEVYLGQEFKPPYKRMLTDTTMLCAKNIYNADNTIAANMLEHKQGDTIEIENIESTITLPLNMRVINMTNLRSFDVEFELNNEDAKNIELLEDATSNNCTNYTIEATNTGYKLSATVHGTLNDCDGLVPSEWFNIKLKRKNKQQSLNTLHYTVTNVNSDACSVNGLSSDILIACPNITSINEANNNDIVIHETSDRITIRSNTPIREYEIYNILGNMIRTHNYNSYNGLNEIELNKYDFPKGMYIIKVRTSSLTTTQYKYTKLIIN